MTCSKRNLARAIPPDDGGKRRKGGNARKRNASGERKRSESAERKRRDAGRRKKRRRRTKTP